VSETNFLVLALAAGGGQAPLYALGAALAVRCGGATLLDLSPVPLLGALTPGAPTLANVLADGGSVGTAPQPYRAEPCLRVLAGGELGPAQILGGAVTGACRELARTGVVLVLVPALHAELLRELFPEAQAVVFAGTGGLEPVLELRRTAQTLQDLLPPTALALLAAPTGDGVALTPSQSAEWLRPLALCDEVGAAVEQVMAGGGGGGSARVALERLRRLREQEQAPVAVAAPDDSEEELLVRRVTAFWQARRRLQQLRREAETLEGKLAAESAELQRLLSL